MVRRAPGAGEARVYDISGRRLAPLEPSLNVGSRSTAAQKRARRKLELQNTDTDLIQDFEFPTVCNRVKTTPDGTHIFASGTYPPQLHVYDTAELSLKFKRHVISDIVDFQILEPSWRKFALLTADRYIDLHSPLGSHFKTRVPRPGRDMMLHRATCDLFVCGDGPDAYRLNLDQGRFLAPIPTRSGASGGNNVCAISPVNALLFFGGENATVDVWDSRTVGRTQSPAGTLNVLDALSARDPATSRLAAKGLARSEITAIRCDESDGVSFAVGTSSGFTLLFDLRSPRAALARDQGNGLPVRSIRLHEDGKHCISADPKGVKVWDRGTGENLVAIEPDANVNHLCLIGNSGVMCTAVEAPRVKTYYVPALGPAPKWCAFLDTFTEELEDGRRKTATGRGRSTVGAEDDDDVEEVYENYKFVSHGELEGLGLAHLIGSDMLKPYMHGYFVHQKLYRRAVEVSEPFAYEKYLKDKARKKLEAERENRITKKKTRKVKVKVNQRVAEAMQEKAKKGGKKAATGLSLLEDSRFSAMFSNEDYAVDEDAERFQHLNPSGPLQDVGKNDDEDEDNSDEEYLERFELVDEDDNGADRDGPGGSDSSSGGEDGDSDEGSDGELDVADHDEGLSIGKERWKGGGKGPGRGPKAPRMYELGAAAEVGGGDGIAGAEGGIRRKKLRDEVSLGARVSLREATARGSGRGVRKGGVHAKR